MDFDEGDVDENQHLACYVLHGQLTKGSSRRAVEKRARKDTAECEYLPSCVNEPPVCGEWRFQAFHTVWSRIQKLIEDIMEEENQDIYEEMQQWICNRQYGDAQQELCQYANASSPVMADAEQTVHFRRTTLRKQLQTALLFLGGIDPSDHEKTLDGLVRHLRGRKCHVARLTSLDFSPTAGVGGPLRILFRQLIECIPETTDMDILLAWHREPGNHGIPVVIVVENAESCDSKILAELILLLSDWIGEIPMVLIMGMATTGEAVRRLLPSKASVRLRLWRFTLKSPPELLEVVMRAVMIDSFCALAFSHEVVAFLYRYFHGHDLTVTAISRAFKVASMEHFWKEPLSFLCAKVLKANSSKAELEEQCAALPPELLDHAATLPSAIRLSSGKKADLPLSMHMAESLWELRADKKMWAMAFLCLESVGKHAGMEFEELLLGALSGSFLSPSAENANVAAEGTKDNDVSEAERKLLPRDRVMSKLRDMPAPALKGVLEEWREVTIHENELNADICRLLSDFDGVAKEKVPCSPDSEAVQAAASNQDYTIRVMNRSKLRRMGLQQTLAGKRTGVNAVRTTAEKLLQRIIRQFLVPPESKPFNEIFCFKDMNVLKEALIGETRKRVHLDILNSRDKLHCKCCPTDGMPSASLHDTTLAYVLSQEHGDLIQVHNWYRSFAAICDPPKPAQGPEEHEQKKGKGRKKKRPIDLDPLPTENLSIEARFTRAATELQIVGLVQLPKKGQSDSVRRICI